MSTNCAISVLVEVGELKIFFQSTALRLNTPWKNNTFLLLISRQKYVDFNIFLKIKFYTPTTISFVLTYIFIINFCRHGNFDSLTLLVMEPNTILTCCPVLSQQTFGNLTSNQTLLIAIRVKSTGENAWHLEAANHRRCLSLIFSKKNLNRKL